MKSLTIVLFFVGMRTLAMAQNPFPIHFFSPIFFENVHLHQHQNVTGVVIIDGDELGITVSPNPASTQITFSGTKLSSVKSISITSSAAKVMMNGKYTSPTIDVKSYTSGTYYYTLTDDLGKVVAQGNFVVQH